MRMTTSELKGELQRTCIDKKFLLKVKTSFLLVIVLILSLLLYVQIMSLGSWTEPNFRTLHIGKYYQHFQNHSRYYVTQDINDARRLGNLIFTYATLLGIAWKNNRLPILKKDIDMFKYFKMGISKSIVNGPVFHTLSFKRCGEAGAIKYDITVGEHLPDADILLEGFYQSYRYFDTIEDIIRDEFTFTEKYQSKAVVFYAEATKSSRVPVKTIRIGIHIRRGDMLNEAQVEFGFTIPDIKYFTNAMSVMRDKYSKEWTIMWVIAGSDYHWSKQHLNIKSGEYAIYPAMDPVSDLAVLSMCDHMIISVGSFSWWAGFLAGGDVIYYKEWPRPGSTLDKLANVSTYFYKHWIPLG